MTVYQQNLVDAMMSNVNNSTTSSSSSRKNSSKNGSLIGGLSTTGGGGGDESPNIGAFWKRHLFMLQEQAPKPQTVPCRTVVKSRPPFYGAEYHGSISRESSDKMLCTAGEGAYLVRESQRAHGTYTLCMRFDNVTKNYKLFYDGCHYVGEKRFDTLDDLVADGLISMYLDKHAADYIRRMAEETIYEETPYSQYRRTHEFQNNKEAAPNNRYVSQSYISPSQSRSVSTEPDLQKAHRFKVHTFKGPHWCDYCGNYMWGLVQQGGKCEDCGFAAHRKCEEKVPQDCRPDMKYIRRQFGVDLTTLTMAYGNAVPLVVAQSIAEVEKRGLDAEGIYRVSGSHEEIEKLRTQYDGLGDSAQSIDLLSKAKVEDVNSVAGLLKLFLRMLPQPLITASVHRELMEAAKRKYESDKLSSVRKCLRQLPPAHQATLRLLIAHLARVADNASRNKMDAENLARVFTPTVMGQWTGSAYPSASMILTQQEQAVLQLMILNCAKIFVDK